MLINKKFQFRNLSVKSIEEEMRLKFRSLPSPVFCITSSIDPSTTNNKNDDNTNIAAMIVNSVTTVSLNPPTISFNIKLPSKFDNLLLTSKSCAIHMLSTNQTELSNIFSKPGSKFENIDYYKGYNNLPIIKGSKWALITDLEKSIEIADHRVWFATVKDIITIENSSDKSKNLIYYNGQYYKIE